MSGPPPPQFGSQGLPQQPGQPQPTPEAQKEQRFNELLEQVLGGQLPGAGYLFADSPEQRQAHLIKTTPEATRDALLRAVETAAENALLPYGAVLKGELAKAALAFSQAYLLLDPTVDENGVPIGAGAEAQGDAQVAATNAQGEQARLTSTHQHALNSDLEEHKADMQARVAAHASGAAFKRAVAQNGYVEPPRVQPNPAEEAIANKHKSQSQELAGARGDRPRPKPRVGE